MHYMNLLYFFIPYSLVTFSCFIVIFCSLPSMFSAFGEGTVLPVLLLMLNLLTLLDDFIGYMIYGFLSFSDVKALTVSVTKKTSLR